MCIIWSRQKYTAISNNQIIVTAYFLGMDSLGGSAYSNGYKISIGQLASYLEVAAGGISYIVLDSGLATRVYNGDSTSLWVTFSQLKDSLNSRVSGISLSQLNDTLIFYVPFRDSLIEYITPTQLEDSLNSHSGGIYYLN